MSQILTISCRDCGGLFYGCVLDRIDKDTAEEVGKYSAAGHKINVMHQDKVDFGNGNCAEAAPEE